MKLILAAVAALALSACGGGSKSADSTPTAGEGAGDDMAATPVETDPAATEAAAEPGATDDTGGNDSAAGCTKLCDRMIACIVELQGVEPSPDQLAEATSQCNTQCAAEPAEKIGKMAACVDENPDDCKGMFQCIEPLQGEPPSE